MFEWEHVAEPFEKATHYLEKALYKVLSQTIVPDVTERLRVSTSIPAEGMAYSKGLFTH